MSAAFPYLNHKLPEKIAPTFLAAAKPLSFGELYSPRAPDAPVAINAQQSLQKSFWRTRDDLTFGLYEWRSKGWMIVTCRDTLKPTLCFRTILLDLPKLYFEVDAKARGARDALLKKKDKGLVDDAALHKAAAAYVLARLNIGADPLPWPTSFAPPPVLPPDAPAEPAPAPPTEATERMASFSFLSGDTETLERPCSLLEGLSLEGIDSTTLKLKPTLVEAAAAPVGDGPAAPADMTLPKISVASVDAPPANKKTTSSPDKTKASGKLPAISPDSGGGGKGAAQKKSTKKL